MKKIILNILIVIFSLVLVGCGATEAEKDYSLSQEIVIVQEMGIEEILDAGSKAQGQFSLCEMLELDIKQELKSKDNYGVIVYTEKNLVNYAFNKTSNVKASLEGKLYQTIDNEETLRLINSFINDGVVYEKDINASSQNYYKEKYSNEELKDSVVVAIDSAFGLVKLSPNAILTAAAYDSVNEGTWITCGKDAEGNVIVQGKIMADRLGLTLDEFVDIRVVITDGKFVYAECKSNNFSYCSKLKYKNVNCDFSKFNEEEYN